ncbi:MAG: hypothetical protein Roseis2KO_07570 [Roseivirga sp.]
MNPFHYRAYGLTIQADFEIEGLVSSEKFDSPDVKISLAKLDVSAYPMIEGFLVRELTSRGFLYGIKDLASFLITDGRTILVDPLSEEKDRWQMYLLGSVMGALLQQRGFLTLHGSAVLANNKAHLILGPSGMGKSSIAMALHQSGCPFLTDDICAIKFNEAGTPQLYYGSRHIKLWQDAIDQLGAAQDNMPSVRNGLPKYRLLLDEVSNNSTYVLGHIFILQLEPLHQSQITFKRLNPIYAMGLLNQNVYRKYFIEQFKLEKHIFTMLSQLTNLTQATLLSRTHAQTDVKEVAKRIKDFLQQ